MCPELGNFAALNRSIAAPVPPTPKGSGFLGDSYETWRRNQQDVLLLGRVKNEVDLFGVPYFDPYTCLVSKSQESPMNLRWFNFVENREAC